MKSRLRSGLLCYCFIFAVQISPAIAQDASQQQPPPQQPPPPVQPPPVSPTPPPAKPQVETQPTPPKPAPSTERDTGGDAFSIEPLFWLTRNSPSLEKGHGSTVARPGNIDSLGKSKYGDGVLITVPTTRENSLQFSYNRFIGRGNSTASKDVNFFGNDYPTGDILSTSYKLENYKVSWNYLTYPYPSSGAKLRIKTLWEVQYTTLKTTIDAPQDTTAATTQGTKKLIYPTLGLGLEYHAGRHVRLELKGSGFGLPHRSVIWDAEASAVFRAGRIEALVGGKAFHFKTSPKADQFFVETLWGPYVGIRYMFK